MMIHFADDPVSVPWDEQNADLVEFLKGATQSRFYQSLYQSYLQYGRLTPRQEECAREGLAKTLNPPADSGLDLTPLDGYYAVPDGETRLKVLIQHGQGKWAGWIFVKDGAIYGTGARFGSQRPGQKYRGKIAKQLEAILADPNEAMAEYGKLTGRCGACHRPLEDETSVALGIGPVCRERLGL